MITTTNTQLLPAAPAQQARATVGLVLIGRNEGARFLRCLDSLRPLNAPAVYVDSGSADGSIEAARARHVDVLPLDLSTPFSAARARHEGFLQLTAAHPDIEFVQFVDGDCEINPAWLPAALHTLESDPKIAVVCGRRRERAPQHSIYNRICDLEWDRPPGPTLSCGGDALFRAAAYRDAGGFNPSVVAGEEPELCARIRARGWTIQRIPAEMTLHDAAISRFSQWWRRHVRGGYGALDVARRFQLRQFRAQLRRSRLWTLGWLAALLISAAAGFLLAHLPGLLLGILLPFGALALQSLRLSLRIKSPALSLPQRLLIGGLSLVAQWAYLAGQIKYLKDRLASRRATIIEYK